MGRADTRWEELPTLRYFPSDTELGLGMVMHDLAGIALDPTSFLCLSRRWGRGELGELATW